MTDITDEPPEPEPQDITCSGGIIIKLGAVFGDRDDVKGQDDGEQSPLV